MIKEKQKTVYSLIISQLRYDGFTDISTQLEEYTCIQTRPNNHLYKLVESVEYQWKITSWFADTACVTSSLSKDSLPIQPLGPDRFINSSEGSALFSRSISSDESMVTVYNPAKNLLSKTLMEANECRLSVHATSQTPSFLNAILICFMLILIFISLNLNVILRMLMSVLKMIF